MEVKVNAKPMAAAKTNIVPWLMCGLKYAMKIGVIPYSLGSNGLFPDKKLQYLKLSKNIYKGQY